MHEKTASLVPGYTYIDRRSRLPCEKWPLVWRGIMRADRLSWCCFYIIICPAKVLTPFTSKSVRLPCCYRYCCSKNTFIYRWRWCICPLIVASDLCHRPACLFLLNRSDTLFWFRVELRESFHLKLIYGSFHYCTNNSIISLWKEEPMEVEGSIHL